MKTNFNYEGWNGFNAGSWTNEINVRDFIQTNYCEYKGDDSFLAQPTARTNDLMKKWRSESLGVRAWGVSDVSLMKKMCDLKVDGMTVNFPDRLFQYINSL